MTAEAEPLAMVCPCCDLPHVPLGGEDICECSRGCDMCGDGGAFDPWGHGREDSDEWVFDEGSGTWWLR